MNRLATIATSLTVAGTVLLGSAAAADPVVNMASYGTPINTGGGSQYGQLVDLSITGCLTPGGDPGYAGQFVEWHEGIDEEPLHFESIVGEDGSLAFQSTTPLTTAARYMDLTWYCSSSPITTMTDPAILWLSPTFDYTIEAAPEGQAPARAAQQLTVTTKTTSKAAPRSTAKVKAKAKAPTVTAKPGPQGGAVTVTVDPNALPKIDKMGIVGPKSAALKAKVDKQIAANHRLENFLLALVGRKPATITNAEYVDTAFQVLTGKNVPAKTEKPYVARLDAGDLRVSVIEDIALTHKNAAYWNAR